MKRVILYALMVVLAGLLVARTPVFTRFIFRNYKVILCIGDSITANSYPQWLHLKFKEKGFRRIKVVNMGKDGFTSGEYLNFMRLKTEWKTIFPDIVLIELGTNDVRIDADHTSTEIFYQNMENIVKLLLDEAKAKGRRMEILLSTIPPVIECNTYDASSVARVTNEINPAITILGDNFGLEVVDNYTFFMQSPDCIHGIHPTQKGYRRMAENWFRHIQPRIKK